MPPQSRPRLEPPMSERLPLRTIDWFVPASLRSDVALLWQTRIFVVSHLAGPCLGALICSATARMAGRVASSKNAPETPEAVATKCSLVS